VPAHGTSVGEGQRQLAGGRVIVGHHGQQLANLLCVDHPAPLVDQIEGPVAAGAAVVELNLRHFVQPQPLDRGGGQPRNDDAHLVFASAQALRRRGDDH
jgi:hypothetical protein